MTKIISIFIFFALLTSCATSPKNLKDSDFLSRDVYLESSVANSLYELRRGLSVCGAYSGGVFSQTFHGIPECQTNPDDGSAFCTLFIGADKTIATHWVLGQIELKPKNNGTVATLKVQTYVANKDKIINAWKMFLQGNAKKVCPNG